MPATDPVMNKLYKFQQWSLVDVSIYQTTIQFPGAGETPMWCSEVSQSDLKSGVGWCLERWSNLKYDRL